MNAGYTGPLVTMIHSHPEVQFPPLSKSELKAAALSSTMQILLPSGIPTAKQYFPNLPIKVIGNSVEIPEYTPHRDPRHPIITSVGTFSTGKINVSLLLHSDCWLIISLTGHWSSGDLLTKAMPKT